MGEFASVDVAVSPVDKFQEFLMTRGMRLTHERAVIVEEVFSTHEHFDADQLAARLSHAQTGRRVSRPTVYRTLKALEEAGLLRKVARAEGREVWEHDYGYPQHDHLICSKCRRLIEFRNERISEILENIAATYQFRVEGHRLEVYGLCDDCARPPKRRHRKLDMV
ncbi:MAG: Fur family transcriptional regulator [Planctomycetaceae bacterium]